MRYLLCIEIAGSNFSAFFPSFPGCIATGATVPEVSRLAAEALADHLAAGGEAIPELPLAAAPATGDAMPGCYFTYVQPIRGPLTKKKPPAAG
jgi:predicted RNase H-like HicB family nuclease